MTESRRPIATHTITQNDAAHVLWVMGDRQGMEMQPGSFRETLIEAAAIADQGNIERLERGFEGLISAVRVYKELPRGTELLRGTAAGGKPF